MERKVYWRLQEGKRAAKASKKLEGQVVVGRASSFSKAVLHPSACLREEKNESWARAGNWRDEARMEGKHSDEFSHENTGHAKAWLNLEERMCL